MIFLKKSGKKRTRVGNGILNAIVGIGIMAGLAYSVGPKLMNADLPAQKSNMRGDVANFNNLVETYGLGTSGDYSTVTLKSLITSNSLTGAMKLSVYNSDGEVSADDGSNLAGDGTDYYAPTWADGEVKLYITGATEDKVTLKTDASASKNKVPLEEVVEKYATKKYGASSITDETDGDGITIVEIQ